MELIGTTKRDGTASLLDTTGASVIFSGIRVSYPGTGYQELPGAADTLGAVCNYSGSDGAAAERLKD